MTSSRAFATALVLATILAGCVATTSRDAERCREWAPEVTPPATLRTAPPGWPDPPPGDVLCGSTLSEGEWSTSMEVAIAVTDRSIGEVLDHYEGALPGDLPVERVGSGAEARLWGHADGVLYAVEPAGDHRYALVFQVLARP